MPTRVNHPLIMTRVLLKNSNVTKTTQCVVHIKNFRSKIYFFRSSCRLHSPVPCFCLAGEWPTLFAPLDPGTRDELQNWNGKTENSNYCEKLLLNMTHWKLIDIQKIKGGQKYYISDRKSLIVVFFNFHFIFILGVVLFLLPDCDRGSIFLPRRRVPLQ